MVDKKRFHLTSSTQSVVQVNTVREPVAIQDNSFQAKEQQFVPKLSIKSYIQKQTKPQANRNRCQKKLTACLSHFLSLHVFINMCILRQTDP